MKKLIPAVLLLAATITLSPALADGSRYFKPVEDPLTKTECGACHMPYPPSLLSQESWKAVMKGLSDHFGDNAFLDAKTAQQIEDYLMANSSPVKGGAAGLRITDTRGWHRWHDGEMPHTNRPAKCDACHAQAARGHFQGD